MYFLFLFKKMRPIEYYNMGPGERRVIHAFMMQEIEDRKNAADGKE